MFEQRFSFRKKLEKREEPSPLHVASFLPRRKARVSRVSDRQRRKHTRIISKRASMGGTLDAWSYDRIKVAGQHHARSPRTMLLGLALSSLLNRYFRHPSHESVVFERLCERLNHPRMWHCSRRATTPENVINNMAKWNRRHWKLDVCQSFAWITTNSLCSFLIYISFHFLCVIVSSINFAGFEVPNNCNKNDMPWH